MAKNKVNFPYKLQGGKKRTLTQQQEDFVYMLKCRDQQPPMAWRVIAENLNRKRGYYVSHVTLFEQYNRLINNYVLENIEEHIGNQRAYYQYIKDEALEAWEKSKGKQEKRTAIIEGKKNDGNANVKKMRVETIVSNGDAVYLEKLLKALNQEAMLLGLNKKLQDPDPVEEEVVKFIELPLEAKPIPVDQPKDDE